MRPRFVPVSMGSPRFQTVDVPWLQVTEARFPSGAVLVPHLHQRACVAVMLEGSFDVSFTARTLACDAGALHTEPAEERHANYIGAAGAHVVVIQPDHGRPDLWRPVGHLLDRVTHCSPSPVTGSAWRLAREMKGTDGAAPLAVEGLALELLALAARGVAAQVIPRRPPRWLLAARDLVHDRVGDRLAIADIARAVGAHPVHLARLFRAHYGVPLGTYVRRLRLDRAAARLAATLEPIARIAYEAGFSDQSHFTRAFRRHTGQTPLQYRRGG